MTAKLRGRGDGPAAADVPPIVAPRLVGRLGGYRTLMLYTILIVLAIIALLVFIFGRRRV